MPMLSASEAIGVVYLEADLLDRHDWDAWLNLYTDDCEYWAPSWLDETQMSTDPKRHVSLIYYDSREGLIDRVQRIRSGRSIASSPMPRTVHAITNARVLPDADSLLIKSNWAVDSYDLRMDRSIRLFGRYEHRITQRAGGTKIASKRIEVMNARLPSVIDIYLI